jgi:hypothetical protein
MILLLPPHWGSPWPWLFADSWPPNLARPLELRRSTGPPKPPGTSRLKSMGDLQDPKMELR